MKSRLCIAAILACLATAAPAQAGGITVTDEKALSPRLSEPTVTTPALDFPATVRVLLPAGYAAHPRRRYPVLYLLHGSFDDAASWTTKGDAEAITAGAPVILVMPAAAGKGDGGGWASDWRNEGRGGVPKWETFTIGELIPWVDGRYRTRARRSARAIAGLSMGGFSAMSYASRHPDLFAAAASFSGAVDTNAAEVQPIIQGETLADGGATPDAIWGPRALDEVYWRAHNPTDLAANLQAMTLSVRTGNGTPGPGDEAPYDPIEAGVHHMSASFDGALNALEIPHVFDDYGAGTHSWPYWQRDLKLELPRIMATFAHPPAAPVPFTYSAAEERYDIYGWTVRLQRTVTEFSTLRAAPRGFAMTGSGSATVTSAPIYRPGSSHDVRVGDAAPYTARADKSGRLTERVDLGPVSTGQQYRPGTETHSKTVAVTVGPRCSRSRALRIRLRRGLRARSVRVGGGAPRAARGRVVRVNLRGRPAGRYRIRVVARDGTRRVVVRVTRRLCTARPARRAEPRLKADPAALAAALECHGAVANASRTPLLLVHGTNVTREENWSWSYGRAFDALAIPWCAMQIPQRATGDLQDNVEYVVAATRIVAGRAGRPIAIVGASQGGMLPRWMLRYWPSTRRMVEELVGIVPSNHGTSANDCDPDCVPALRQQSAGSHFLLALNRGPETYAGIDYTNIITHRDTTVVPADSGYLTTGAGTIANVATQDLCPADPFEHITTPTVDPVAFALTLDALTHPGPADAARLQAQGCAQPPIPDQDLAGGAAAAESVARGEGKVPPTTSEPALRCYAVAAGCRRARSPGDVGKRR